MVAKKQQIKKMLPVSGNKAAKAGTVPGFAAVQKTTGLHMP
jgi:hypothetical protein